MEAEQTFSIQQWRTKKRTIGIPHLIARH